MNKHRYTLASNKVPKTNCPQCGAKKHWQRYIDIETGEVLPEQHGRCDNEQKCGHWVTPKDTGYAKKIWEQERGNYSELPNNMKPRRMRINPKPKLKTVYFNFETFLQTLKPERYKKNKFIQNLLNRVKFPFEDSDITKVIKLYRLGTISKGYRAGAVTFPFIDNMNRVTAIQVKEFDIANHTISTDFLHSIIEKHHIKKGKPLPKWVKAYAKQDKLVSCLFGEHLLCKYPLNPVALVEAPKTAIYGTLYFGIPESPECLIWLAVYNKSSFSLEKVRALQGREVYIFPDLSKDGSTFKEWKDKAKSFENELPGTRFIFSDILERMAPNEDKQKGMDLADYLIQHDWRKLRKHKRKESHEKLPEPPVLKEKVEPVIRKYQTVAEVFDIMKEKWGDNIPSNFLGIKAGIWKTQ